MLGAVAFIFYVDIPEFVVKKYERQRALKAQQEQTNIGAPASPAALLPDRMV